MNLVERRLVAAAGESPARYEAVELYGPEQSVDVALDGARLGSIVVGELLP